MNNIPLQISSELGVHASQVEAAITLLDEGATVPFIARYRKEVTGALDDTQLRSLEDRLGYLRDLEVRRGVILAAIDEQGKLTPLLKAAIESAATKTRLEDLYLPYIKKRKTRAQIAIEAGIMPLADRLLQHPDLVPETQAQGFVNLNEEFKGAFVDAKGVLEGARSILMERFAEDADLLAEVRNFMLGEGLLGSTVISGKETEAAKYRDYFDHSTGIGKLPSHRVLAMLRGRKEGFLNLQIDVDHDERVAHPCVTMICRHFNIENLNRAADSWLAEVARLAWRSKVHLHLETDLMTALRTSAEITAIGVFANNLKDLLLAAPAGQKVTIGLDPGLRTGVKLAVITSTGQFVDSGTIYPHAPRNNWDESIASLAALAAKHRVELLAIGNGTASRETDRLCTDLIKRHPELHLKKILVSEAGASVYSASELAALEFPDLDVTIRGAVSIARRLQDPLAELVKIDPKSIGVGQYQHDVSQHKLARQLDAVVEDCVNAVGVEVNTASAALLRRVAGLSQSIADNIVQFRDSKGGIKNRAQLLDVPRLGGKTYEQAAGFLRIRNAENPLDATAVHPEAYSVVETIARRMGFGIGHLIGHPSLKDVNPADYTDEHFGLFTVRDILAELEKPGRDPRPEFKAAQLLDGVESIGDLVEGMIIEGTVTNVTNFGAFVDIGVHQDGLVHISAMANHFVKDPHDVVKAGEIVKTKIISVDRDRKRIALTMRLDDEPETGTPAKPGETTSRDQRKAGDRRSGKKKASQKTASQSKSPSSSGALAQAFDKARLQQAARGDGQGGTKKNQGK